MTGTFQMLTSYENTHKHEAGNAEDKNVLLQQVTTALLYRFDIGSGLKCLALALTPNAIGVLLGVLGGAALGVLQHPQAVGKVGNF